MWFTRMIIFIQKYVPHTTQYYNCYIAIIIVTVYVKHNERGNAAQKTNLDYICSFFFNSLKSLRRVIAIRPYIMV